MTTILRRESDRILRKSAPSAHMRGHKSVLPVLKTKHRSLLEVIHLELVLHRLGGNLHVKSDASFSSITSNSPYSCAGACALAVEPACPSFQWLASASRRVRCGPSALQGGFLSKMSSSFVRSSTSANLAVRSCFGVRPPGPFT